MALRLGEVMMNQGLLTAEQVERILDEQRRTSRPFGEIAERLFGLDERAVESAWAVQYAQIAERVDPRDVELDEEVLAMVDRRQAWQFRIMPLRRDGREIMLATVVEHLPRAMRFALRHFPEPCYFVLTSAEALGEAMMRHFPMQGMTPDAVLATQSPFLTKR